jgi:hypothetical protein
MNTNATSVLGIALAGLAAGTALAKPGALRNLGKIEEWPNVHAMAALDGRLYVAAGLTIQSWDKSGRVVDLFGGKSPDWGTLEVMTAFDGKIYGLGGDYSLYAIEKTGKVTALTEGWNQNRGLAAIDGKLYAISERALWEVDKQGKYKKLGEPFEGVNAMTALDGKLYIAQGLELMEVDTAGHRTQLPGTWEPVVGMTSTNGKLYIFTNGSVPTLHEVDKRGTAKAILPSGLDGAAASAITALDGTIYMTVNRQMGSSGTTLFALDVK